jgi:hypothetical protein
MRPELAALGEAQGGVRGERRVDGLQRGMRPPGKMYFGMPFIIEADAAGRAICAGLERGRTEIVFPRRMAVLMKAARFVPVRMWAALWGHRR